MITVTFICIISFIIVVVWIGNIIIFSYNELLFYINILNAIIGRSSDIVFVIYCY